MDPMTSMWTAAWVPAARRSPVQITTSTEDIISGLGAAAEVGEEEEEEDDEGEEGWAVA